MKKELMQPVDAIAPNVVNERGHATTIIHRLNGDEVQLLDGARRLMAELQVYGVAHVVLPDRSTIAVESIAGRLVEVTEKRID